MKGLAGGIGVVVMAGLLASCQAVFTYSPLAGFAQNPSTMSTAQKIEYAKQALATGDAQTMKTAYDAIKSSSDPETNLLAAELAFGASDATTVLTQALGDLSSGSDLTSLTPLLDKVDIALVTQGADHLAVADANNVPITDSQYAIGAAALATSAAQQAGGFDQLANLTSGDPGYSDLQTAQSLADKISSPDLNSTINQLL